eukprot:m.134068 g.134068  ORF g.134068 m.134068 type:complete len:324 (+) comp29718_c0_seq1:96-1067(+)
MSHASSNSSKSKMSENATNLTHRLFKVTDIMSTSPSTTTAPPTQKLRIVTWNVWFGRKKMIERLEALVGILDKIDPDVIGLQEVVPDFAQALRCLVNTSKPLPDVPNSPSVWQKYAISKNKIKGYGCLLLAKKSLSPKFSETKMPTRMGRTLLTANICCGGSKKFRLNIGTSHFESMDSPATRQKQLTIARKTLNATSSHQAVLIGDFNFDSSQEYGDWKLLSTPTEPDKLENVVAFEAAGMKSWIDAWHALHPQDKGYTFDGAVNSNVNDKQERMRYDRVMISPGEWNAASVCLLGTESIDDTQNTCPSDHFGVCVEIQRSA